MKTVSYKDSYESLPVVIQIEDYEEGIKEILEFLNDDARITQNLERKERYHTVYHIEGLVYEGEDYAADDDVEAETMKRQAERDIDEWLYENLTGAQYRRFRFFMDGMSIHEIAKMEGVDYSSVNDSIKASQKKLKKIYKNHPSKALFQSPYSEK